MARGSLKGDQSIKPLFLVSGEKCFADVKIVNGYSRRCRSGKETDNQKKGSGYKERGVVQD